MNQKEKIKSEMEAKLTQLGQSIEELKQKAEIQEEKFTSIHRKTIEDLVQNKAKAEQKLQSLTDADEGSRSDMKEELATFMSDMDQRLREALAYFH